MKLKSYAVEYLICEECDAKLVEYQHQGNLQASWGCHGCGRLICSNCNMVEDFQYKGWGIRLCRHCLGEMKITEFLEQCQGRGSSNTRWA